MTGQTTGRTVSFLIGTCISHSGYEYPPAPLYLTRQLLNYGVPSRDLSTAREIPVPRGVQSANDESEIARHSEWRAGEI